MVIIKKDPGKNSFTLIETIGVLAIVAIILSMLVPNLFKTISETHIRNERQLMKAFEDAFKKNSMRNRRIPDHNGWADALSKELAIPIENVTNIFKTPRVFLIHPQFQIGPNLQSLPYTQGTNGSLQPKNARVMIISSLGPPLPVQSGIFQDFDRVWNTPDGQIPTVWQNSWKSKPEFLTIQRIELAPLFKFVIINNLDPDWNAIISIDNSPLIVVPRTPEGFSGFFFRDTVFSFYDTNGVKVSESVLMGDYSFVFESGAWRGKLLDGRQKLEARFQQAYYNFLNAPVNPGAKFGAKPINVLEFFCGYARAYTLWSLEGFQYKTSQQQYPAQQQANDYQQLLSQTARDLID